MSEELTDPEEENEDELETDLCSAMAKVGAVPEATEPEAVAKLGSQQCEIAPAATVAPTGLAATLADDLAETDSLPSATSPAEALPPSQGREEETKAALPPRLESGVLPGMQHVAESHLALPESRVQAAPAPATTIDPGALAEPASGNKMDAELAAQRAQWHALFLAQQQRRLLQEQVEEEEKLLRQAEEQVRELRRLREARAAEEMEQRREEEQAAELLRLQEARAAKQIELEQEQALERDRAEAERIQATLLANQDDHRRTAATPRVFSPAGSETHRPESLERPLIVAATATALAAAVPVMRPAPSSASVSLVVPGDATKIIR